MAENSFKKRIKADVPKTKLSNNTNNCRNLTPEEIEQIKDYSSRCKGMNMNTYNWNKMREILRSKILKGVINMHMAKGENIGSMNIEDIEREAENWLDFNEKEFKLNQYKYEGFDNEIIIHKVDEFLPLLIIPGQEKERQISIQGNTQK